MIIREYKPEDREAVEKCIFELQEIERDLEPNFREEGFKISSEYFEFLEKRQSQHQGKMFVGELEGKVVGYMAVLVDEVTSPCDSVKKRVYITDIIVLAEYQKRGIGKALMSKAEEFAVEKRLNLELDVLVKNKSAIKLYHSIGFRDYNLGMLKELNNG